MVPRQIAFLVFAFSLSALVNGAEAEVCFTSAEALLEEVDERDSKAIVIRLWKDHSCWGSVLSEVASAEPAWLHVAERLKPGADAGASLALRHAIARALPHSPEAVLALIDKGFSLESVCTTPFLEEPLEIVVRYLERTEAALKTVSPAISHREECLEKISTARTKLSAQFLKENPDSAILE